MHKIKSFFETIKSNKSLQRTLLILGGALVGIALICITVNLLPESKNKTYALGATFTFNDLKFTLGEADDITWGSTETDNGNADVIILPVTVKNRKNRLHNLSRYDVTFFGPSGDPLKPVYTSFADDDIFYAGNIKAGKSIDSLFHILYDGDGEYRMELDKSSDHIVVVFSISKPVDESAQRETTHPQTEPTTEEVPTEPLTEPPATDPPSTEPPATQSPVTDPPATQPSTEPEAERPAQSQENQITVYITPSGKKYHYANPCGRGKYSPITLQEALSRGYEPCEKCVLH